MRATYEQQTDPRYAAARLWVDAIIDPAHTREALIWALEAAALNPDVREFQDRSSANVDLDSNSRLSALTWTSHCTGRRR